MLKNTLLLLFTAITLTSFAQSQEQFVPIADAKKHKVIAVTELFQNYDEAGNIIPNNHKSFIEQYNSQGYLKMRINFNPNNTKRNSYSFHYNNKHQIDGVIIKNGKDIIVDKHTIRYNKKGLVTKEEGLATGNQYVITYKYNENEKLIKKEKKDKSGKTISQKDFKYNNENKIIKEIYIGKKTYTTAYNYNKKGEQIKISYSVDTTVNYTLKYTYTDKGEINTEEKYDQIHRIIYRITYHYAENNKATKVEQQYSQLMGGYYKKWEYIYNEHEHIKQIKMYNFTDKVPVSITKYIYKEKK